MHRTTRSQVAIGVILCISVIRTPASAAGDVHFENSCVSDVRATFDHAVTMLHSFEYPESERLFRVILDEQPNCEMAKWGIAMSRWHPLWAPPSTADLEAGMEIIATISDHDLSARERAYVDAVRVFYTNAVPANHGQRAKAYEEQMLAVYTDYLEDPEAAVFYALSLLATADPKDKSYPHQFKAAGLLNWVGERQRTHPGVLHYTIHSYDFPGMAHLALKAALTYAGAAPDSAHAQHMPSHIFTRLGLWERSIASNHDSTASAAEYTVRARLPGHYDEGLHSMDYLMYALLQTARDDEAAELLGHLRGIGKTDTENFKVAYTYAAAPARYALERRQWTEASELELKPDTFDWREFGWARSIHHFARGIGAARGGRQDKARHELAMLRSIESGLPETTLAYWREEVSVQVDALASWIDLAEGRTDRALQLAAAAADREDSVDKHPVTPGEVLPARELYGDMLLQVGAAERALTQYRQVLAGSPKRLNTLCGAARAAVQSGDRDAAGTYYSAMLDQTADGNQDRACVLEAATKMPLTAVD